MKKTRELLRELKEEKCVNNPVPDILLPRPLWRKKATTLMIAAFSHRSVLNLFSRLQEEKQHSQMFELILDQKIEC